MLRFGWNASGSVSDSLYTKSNFVAYIFIDFCVFIMRDWDWDGYSTGEHWCLSVWPRFD